MSNIENVRLISGRNGCCRVSFLAENLTTGLYALFSIKLSVPDEGISYSTGTLQGRVPETQYNTNCNGKGIGKTKGNTTESPQSISISLGDDYNLLQDIDPTIARNMIVSVFKGGSFKIGAETWSVIGTNGVRTIAVDTNDNDFKYLFLKDGEVIAPDKKNADGTMRTESNGFVAPYTENNCVMMEFLYAFNDNNRNGDRFVYLLGSDSTFNEGSGADYNRYEIASERYSDARAISKYVIDGLTNAQTLATVGTDALYRIETKMVIEIAGGLGVGTIGVAGVVGEQLVIINSTNNTIELYKHDGTDFVNVPVTSTLGVGALIYSTQYDTALTGATATNKAGLVAIKTAGASGVAVAVTNKSNIAVPGTASAFVEIYDWVYSSQIFANYTGIEV